MKNDFLFIGSRGQRMASACYFVCIFWRSYNKVWLFICPEEHELILVIFFYWKSLLSHSNSFYRNDFDKKKRDFFGGIERNLQRIQTDFPGSVMRLYYQVPNESLFLQNACKLACTVPNFDLCDVERIPSMGKHISFLYLFIP